MILLVTTDHNRFLPKLFQKRSKELSQRTGKLSSLLDDDDSDAEDSKGKTEDDGNLKTGQVNTWRARVEASPSRRLKPPKGTPTYKGRLCSSEILKRSPKRFLNGKRAKVPPVAEHL